MLSILSLKIIEESSRSRSKPWWWKCSQH